MSSYDLNNQDAAPDRRGWVVYSTTIALMVATAMQAFDATIANVALPQLERSYGAGIDLGSWVMTSYLCASAVVAPMTGWLRRRYGPRRLFDAAIWLFVAASLLCAGAPSATALIVFRLIQGASGGIIQPLSQAILLDIYPKRSHGRMLGLWGAAIMVGPVLGPLLGGIITDLAEWRWIFVINLPLGLIALLGLRRFRPAMEHTRSAKIDGFGILLLIVGVGAAQLCLERSIGRSWLKTPDLIIEAVVAIVAIVLLISRRYSRDRSLIRFAVFHDLNFATAGFYNFMVCAMLFSTIVFLPSLGETLLGYSATVAGLTIFPRGLATMLTMIAVGHAIGVIGFRMLLISGLVLLAAALDLLAGVPGHDAAIWFACTSTLQGVGVGLLFTPLSTLAFSTLAADLRTDAAGLYSLLRQLGSATGVAVMTAILQARTGSETTILSHTAPILAMSPPKLAAAAQFAAYADCFRIMAVVTMLIIPGIFVFRTRLSAMETPPG